MSSKKLKCGRIAPTYHQKQTQDTSDRWQNKLASFVTAKGLKTSEPRTQIAALILSEKKHLDAQEIVDRVRKTHPGIGPATVYRNLKLLCEAGILRETMNDLVGRVVYESLLDEEHHDHLICLDCEEVFEFHNVKLESLQDKVTQDLGFQAESHRHVIYARCSQLLHAKESRA